MLGPPEGVETADVYRCRSCGVLTTSNIHCYAHCDPVDAVALLAKQEKLDRITARLAELGVIAPEGRDPDGERFDVADTVLALLAEPIADTGRLRDSAPRLPLLERLHRAEAQRDAAVARAEQAEAERDEARKMLGECYLLSGADPDGNDWPHLWRDAVQAVKELRADYDEVADASG